MFQELFTFQQSLVQIDIASLAQGAPQQSRRLHKLSKFDHPAPAYSHVAMVHLSNDARLLTIAGQVGKDPQGNVAPDFAGQVELARCNKDENH